jgi:hypothetical protein
MEKKLNNKEVQRVFAMYIECEVIAPHPQEEGELLKGYLTGIHGELEAEIQHHDGLHAWEHPEYHDFVNTKLLLKDLSQISDEDAAVLIEMVFEHMRGTKWIRFERNEEGVFAYYKGYEKHQSIAIRWRFLPDTAFQFLITRRYAVPLWFGIDHPCNGLDAITLGLAIKQD